VRKVGFTSESLEVYEISHRPLAFFSLSSSSGAPPSGSAPLPPTASAAHRRSNSSPAPPPARADSTRRLPPFPGPAPLPCCPILRVPRLPELLPGATSPPPCPAPVPALLPFLFYPAAPADDTQPISLTFALHAHPELQNHRRPLFSTPAGFCSPWVDHSGHSRSPTTPQLASF
jgi:hypothetical protein